MQYSQRFIRLHVNVDVHHRGILLKFEPRERYVGELKTVHLHTALFLVYLLECLQHRLTDVLVFLGEPYPSFRLLFLLFILHSHSVSDNIVVLRLVRYLVCPIPKLLYWLCHLSLEQVLSYSFIRHFL